MASLVSIVNKSPEGSPPVMVLVQAIKEDGRERHDNGIHFVHPGKSRDFLVDDEQCLRLSEGETA